ncbi:hypothetical protein M0R45_035960 [Rubus argutus]|uniref:HD-Zip IV C-terminal domain-containing protein n=1 Tax=Rubus argutus TaxID=59490 RepID=A0AAW1W072_RUBAR
MVTQRPDPGGSYPQEKKKATRREASHVQRRLVLATPYVPAREAQFVRYSHQHWMEAGLNGSSLVTWVENVDVREKEDEMHAILKPFVESSFCIRERVVGFQLFNDRQSALSTPRAALWSSSHLITSLRLPSRHTEPTSIGTYVERQLLVQALANITMGPDPRNCISVLAMSNHKEILILQECCTDATGSYVIFAPITPDVFLSMLYGVDQDIPLMPFGFSILPNVSGSILDGTLPQ